MDWPFRVREEVRVEQFTAFPDFFVVLNSPVVFINYSKPATFRYPIWSLICDFKLWKEVVTGKRAF
jgi:hypothetical protein